MHEVVPMAVRNAVSAATRTFTASSMILCFFIISSFLFLSHRFHRFSQIFFLSRIWELENFSAMIRIFASQWIWELSPAEDSFVTQKSWKSQKFSSSGLFALRLQIMFICLSYVLLFLRPVGSKRLLASPSASVKKICSSVIMSFLCSYVYIIL